MDYETSQEERSRYYSSAFGKKFLAHTDIANCFPSIYSHTLPWVLVGRSRAKNKQFIPTWFNNIDKAIRYGSRKETSGIPIGPATSNIASEIILERVDRDLRRNFEYIRFIDDYITNN